MFPCVPLVPAAVVALAFSFSLRSQTCTAAFRGLYPGGGVWVWVRQSVILPAAGVGVERVEWGEPPYVARDHGNSVWCHERDVIRRAPHGKSVVWWASSPQHHIMWMQAVPNPSAIPIQIWVLFHLQGHNLLLLSVGQIIGGTSLRAAVPMDVVPSLVLLVVKRSECQNVEKEQRSSDGNCYWQLGRVIPLVHQVRLVLDVLGFGWEWSWVWTFGDQNLGLRGAIGDIWWRDLKPQSQQRVFTLIFSPIKLTLVDPNLNIMSNFA